MSVWPKNKSSKARRDKRRANWKMSAPNLVKCSKCGALMMPHRVCKACGSYNKKEVVAMDGLNIQKRDQFPCAMQQKAPVPGGFFVGWKRHIKDLTWCVVMCYNGLGEN